MTRMEATGGCRTSALPGIYEAFSRLAQTGKLRIEYIFLILGRQSLEKDDVKFRLTKFHEYASEIRVVYQDETRLTVDDLELSIGLIPTQRAVFTHSRDPSGRMTLPTRWINEKDYEVLRERYSRIRLDSHEFYRHAHFR
jgi:hypothetical protein